MIEKYTSKSKRQMILWQYEFSFWNKYENHKKKRKIIIIFFLSLQQKNLLIAKNMCNDYNRALKPENYLICFLIFIFFFLNRLQEPINELNDKCIMSMNIYSYMYVIHIFFVQLFIISLFKISFFFFQFKIKS